MHTFEFPWCRKLLTLNNAGVTNDVNARRIRNLRQFLDHIPSSTPPILLPSFIRCENSLINVNQYYLQLDTIEPAVVRNFQLSWTDRPPVLHPPSMRLIAAIGVTCNFSRQVSVNRTRILRKIDLIGEEARIPNEMNDRSAKIAIEVAPSKSHLLASWRESSCRNRSGSVYAPVSTIAFSHNATRTFSRTRASILRALFGFICVSFPATLPDSMELGRNLHRERRRSGESNEKGRQLHRNTRRTRASCTRVRVSVCP